MAEKLRNGATLPPYCLRQHHLGGGFLAICDEDGNELPRTKEQTELMVHICNVHGEQVTLLRNVERFLGAYKPGQKKHSEAQFLAKAIRRQLALARTLEV